MRRAAPSEPVARNVAVAGSYISALARIDALLDAPPAISTRPSGSNVAECCERGAVMLPVDVNGPADCALATAVDPKDAARKTSSKREWRRTRLQLLSVIALRSWAALWRYVKNDCASSTPLPHSPRAQT